MTDLGEPGGFEDAAAADVQLTPAISARAP